MSTHGSRRPNWSSSNASSSYYSSSGSSHTSSSNASSSYYSSSGSPHTSSSSSATLVASNELVYSEDEDSDNGYSENEYSNYRPVYSEDDEDHEPAHAMPRVQSGNSGHLKGVAVSQSNLTKSRRDEKMLLNPIVKFSDFCAHNNKDSESYYSPQPYVQSSTTSYSTTTSGDTGHPPLSKDKISRMKNWNNKVELGAPAPPSEAGSAALISIADMSSVSKSRDHPRSHRTLAPTSSNTSSSASSRYTGSTSRTSSRAIRKSKNLDKAKDKSSAQADDTGSESAESDITVKATAHVSKKKPSRSSKSSTISREKRKHRK